MTVVVFEMVALGFEDVSVLVFHLPPCSSCLNQLGDIALGEGEVGNKGILIEDFTSVGAGEGQFDPIDFKSCLSAVQWQLIHIAVGSTLMKPPVPGANGKALQSPSLFKGCHLLIEGFVRIGFTDQDEVKAMGK